MNFINSLQVEWLKTRRSAASWLCLAGGFFLPLMYLIGFLKDHRTINDITGKTNSWLIYFTQVWEFMIMALLPMGIILVTGLIAQTEYRNDSWKQLHTTPQSWINIFCAKLAVLFLMVLKFFIFFNVGLIIAAIIPTLLLEHGLPHDLLPVPDLLKANLKILIVCLPVIALQYLISLQFRNFLVPLGFGLLLWIGSLILVGSWSYAWLSPYSYTALLTMQNKGHAVSVNIFRLALSYFTLITLISYLLYHTKKDKA